MASAASDGFSGQSGAYFNFEELEEFAKALGAVLLSADGKRYSVAGGFGASADGTEPAQEQLINKCVRS